MTRSIIGYCKFAVLAGCLVVFSAGCRTKTSAAGLMMESYPSNRVQVNSRVFGNWFRIVSSAVAKSESDLLKVTVTLENLQNKDCAVEYRFRWLDADGIEITSGMTTWMAKSAGARETLLLSGIAPTKRAEDFIVDIRFVHKSTRWI